MGYQTHESQIGLEVQQKYQAAFSVFANRCLGEPFNFHRIAAVLHPGMLSADIVPARIVKACLSQFVSKGTYSPQSIAAECGITPGEAAAMSMRDAEISAADAFEVFTLFHGQMSELHISKTIESLVFKGLSSEEIQAEVSKCRRDMGLSARLQASDGKEEFEAKLSAALKGLKFDYPVTPFLASMREKSPHFEPGDYIVVAALTGNGKTYFALNQIYHLSVLGVPSCIINLENTPANIQKRVWQMHTGVKFRSDMSDVSPDEMRRYVVSWEEVKNMPFKSFNPGRTLQAVLSTIRQDWHERRIQFAVVDYAQLMNDPTYKGNRNYELGEISSALRSLALELQIPIMVLAQFKQEVSQRGDKRGGLHDIKDCFGFAQDATMMISLYRPEVFDIFEDDNGIPYPQGYADAFVAKGRETGPFLSKCQFDAIRGFFDMASEVQYSTPHTEPKTPEFNPAAIPGSDRRDVDIPF